MITQDDVELVEGWATAFQNAYPIFIWSGDGNDKTGRHVYQVDPAYWRGMMVDFENLALRMRDHLASSDIGKEIPVDTKDETPTVTFNGKVTDPYFVKWGEKIVTHLEKLDVVRRLSASDREVVSAFLGGMMESQANSHFEIGRLTARLDTSELIRQELEKYLYGQRN